MKNPKLKSSAKKISFEWQHRRTSSTDLTVSMSFNSLLKITTIDL